MAVRMMIANAECLLHDKLLSVGNINTLGKCVVGIYYLTVNVIHASVSILNV